LSSAIHIVAWYGCTTWISPILAIVFSYPFCGLGFFFSWISCGLGFLLSVEFIISGLGPLLFSVLSWLAFLFAMAALQEALKAIEAAQLSKRNTWIAMRALFAHGDSCTDEVGERLEFVRPALQALVAGKQPTGSQRRRRNIALHSTLDGHRLGCRGDSSDASGSGGTVPSTSAQLFDIFDSECSTQEAG
jgi:hypothetical protein